MCFARNVLGWNRGTPRKGLRELAQGVAATDDGANCGRPRSGAKLPDLVADIPAIVQPRSQVDPTFRSTRLCTPLTARVIRARLSSLGKCQAGQLPGRRPRWLWRPVQFSQAQNIEIQLVYYPPYHSKYNPVERVWGILENHWNGELLNTAQKALGLARTMTYRGLSPTVKLVRKIYHKGVSQTKEAMKQIQNNLNRTTDLEPWFITIRP